MEDKYGGLSFRERLTRLELKQEALAEERKEIRQSVDELTVEIRQQFEGISGSPGISTRLDRLEQTEKGRSRWLWLRISTSVGVIATIIVDIILRK